MSEARTKQTIPAALRRPQSITAFLTLGVAMVASPIIPRLRSCEGDGACVGELVYCLMYHVESSFVKARKTVLHAFGRFVCALIDSLFLNEAIYNRYADPGGSAPGIS